LAKKRTCLWRDLEQARRRGTTRTSVPVGAVALAVGSQIAVAVTPAVAAGFLAVGGTRVIGVLGTGKEEIEKEW
jgi:hypothetical protein